MAARDGQKGPTDAGEDSLKETVSARAFVVAFVPARFVESLSFTFIFKGKLNLSLCLSSSTYK